MKLPNEPVVPFAYSGLVPDFNGIDVTQTLDYIEINCPGYIDRILRTHGWTETKNMQLSVITSNPQYNYLFLKLINYTSRTDPLFYLLLDPSDRVYGSINCYNVSRFKFNSCIFRPNYCRDSMFASNLYIYIYIYNIHIR